LCEAAKKLKEFGATSVSAFATHGLFNGKAFERIHDSDLTTVVVTNTTPQKPGEAECSKVIRLSVGKKLPFIISSFAC
jgi:ribose-phosphate pyrophosphokinase